MTEPLSLNRIYHMAACDLLRRLPEPVQLFTIDPPWGIHFRSNYKTKQPPRSTRNLKGPRSKEEVSTKAKRTFDDSRVDTSWMSLAFDALADGGAMYLFTHWRVLHLWRAAAEEAGFKVGQLIVWDKALWTQGNLKIYGSQTELILFCMKGKHQLRWDKRAGNLWKFGRGSTTGRDGGGRHSCQKPTALMEHIILNSSDAGSLVVDPFTGSGSSMVAAQHLGREFIGGDINAEFAQAAQQWVDQAKKKTQAQMRPMFDQLAICQPMQLALI